MTRVRLSDITFDAGTQIRAAIDEQVVADYADAMTAGAQFPPIVLFHDGNRHYLADGFHRYMAAQRNQWREIEADVRPGTQQDALWFALGANRRHGLKLSQADKRRAARVAIEAWPDRSARAIAEQIGVDPGFVADMKRKHDMGTSAPENVIGRDGKRYPASGNARVAPERTAEVIAKLSSGNGVSAVAESLRMSTRTVQKIRQAAGIPEKLDKSKAAVAERRDRIREMAGHGYTSKQIAAAVGLDERTVPVVAKAEGIDIPADRVVGRAHRHDSNRIVVQIVADAENLTEGVDLVNFAELDRAQIAEWLKSLQSSRDKLGGFIRRLMKEQQKHGEAA